MYLPVHIGDDYDGQYTYTYIHLPVHITDSAVSGL